MRCLLSGGPIVMDLRSAEKRGGLLSDGRGSCVPRPRMSGIVYSVWLLYQCCARWTRVGITFRWQRPWQMDRFLFHKANKCCKQAQRTVIITVLLLRPSSLSQFVAFVSSSKKRLSDSGVSKSEGQKFIADKNFKCRKVPHADRNSLWWIPDQSWQGNK